MAKARTLVGLDVHATKIVAAVLDAETGEVAFFSMTAGSRGKPSATEKRSSPHGCRSAGAQRRLLWPWRRWLPHFSGASQGPATTHWIDRLAG